MCQKKVKLRISSRRKDRNPMITNVMYIIVTKLGRFHTLCNCSDFNAFRNYKLSHSGSDDGEEALEYLFTGWRSYIIKLRSGWL